MIEMLDTQRDLVGEFAARINPSNATVATFEQGYAQIVFQRRDASADTGSPSAPAA